MYRAILMGNIHHVIHVYKEYNIFFLSQPEKVFLRTLLPISPLRNYTPALKSENLWISLILGGVCQSQYVSETKTLHTEITLL